jgi:hypothetical protein
MTDTEALTRRDDELLMGDEGLGPVADSRERLGDDATSQPKRAKKAKRARPSITHDELPRDARGVVVGAWHVAECPERHADMLERTGFLDPYLYGHDVDRAVAFGCRVEPGTRPTE